VSKTACLAPAAGPHRAKYYLTTSVRMDADIAERFGLVQTVVDDDQLMNGALVIATRLAAAPA
jgi:enoyl-CoA hydratase/carnithine racemase